MIRYATFVVFVTASLALVVGCTRTPSTVIKESELRKNNDPASKSLKPKEPLPVSKSISSDLKTLVEGNNQFAFDLYTQLSQKPGNILFSPYSISSALTMAYAGAGGNTAKEMSQTLHLTLLDDRQYYAYNELTDRINTLKNKNCELLVTNSLWSDKNALINHKFLQIMQSHFQTGMNFVDFNSNSEEARRTINQWVEDKTNKNIENLFPAGSLTSNTRLVLANAIYFKGEWAMPFSSKATKRVRFTISAKSAETVLMMNNSIFADYAENEHFQMAELPYAGSDIVMTIILPKSNPANQGNNIIFRSDCLSDLLSKIERRTIDIFLPKFEMSIRSNIDEYLVKMGMIDAFKSAEADFSTMSNNERLSISKVAHKAMILVDENGSEAAAATSVTMVSSSQLAKVRFYADHPFIFMLRHKTTKSILFIGQYYQPSSSTR